MTGDPRSSMAAAKGAREPAAADDERHDGSARAMTRVLLVDDHPLVRAGLATLIQSTDDLDLVGEAAGGEQAVTMTTDHEPDVVLMDLSMPGIDGVEATRRLLALRPQTHVVVLTSFQDQARVAEALAAGAVGYPVSYTHLRAH